MKKAYKTVILKGILKVQRIWQRNVIYEKYQMKNYLKKRDLSEA